MNYFNKFYTQTSNLYSKEHPGRNLTTDLWQVLQTILVIWMAASLVVWYYTG